VQAAWLARVHRQLPPSDFSRDVLARLGPAADLRAIVAPACGWSDWGTPERVFASLQGADLASLRARVRAGAALGAPS
jgi:hypothetical protein